MWLFEEKEFSETPEKMVGFIYLITNLETGRKYIGRKNFTTKKVKQTKGVKKKLVVDSDWLDYNSSSNELKSDIELFGKDKFLKEIICLCPSKGTLNYLESKLIFKLNCLESTEWYNYWVSARIHKSHLKKLPDVIYNKNLSIDINS